MRTAKTTNETAGTSRTTSSSRTRPSSGRVFWHPTRDGLSLYEYAKGRPVVLRDPTGHDGEAAPRDRNIKSDTKRTVIRYDGKAKDKEKALRDAIADHNETAADDQKIGESRANDIVNVIMGGHEGYMGPRTTVDEKVAERDKRRKPTRWCVKGVRMTQAIVVLPHDATDDVIEHELDHWEAAQDAIDAANAALSGFPDSGEPGEGKSLTPEERTRWTKESAEKVDSASREPDKTDADGKRIPWEKNVAQGSPKPHSTYLK